MLFTKLVTLAAIATAVISGEPTMRHEECESTSIVYKLDPMVNQQKSTLKIATWVKNECAGPSPFPLENDDYPYEGINSIWTRTYYAVVHRIWEVEKVKHILFTHQGRDHNTGGCAHQNGNMVNEATKSTKLEKKKTQHTRKKKKSAKKSPFIHPTPICDPGEIGFILKKGEYSTDSMEWCSRIGAYMASGCSGRSPYPIDSWGADYGYYPKGSVIATSLHTANGQMFCQVTEVMRKGKKTHSGTIDYCRPTESFYVPVGTPNSDYREALIEFMRGGCKIAPPLTTFYPTAPDDAANIMKVTIKNWYGSYHGETKRRFRKMRTEGAEMHPLEPRNIRRPASYRHASYPVPGEDEEREYEL